MEKMSSGKNVKKRNWAFVLYPESAPENWREMLQKTGLQCAISPIHDRDVYTDGEHIGEPKKPHYHVLLCYSGPTSFNVVKTLCDSLNQPIPIYLESVRGYYRYFTHKDNPDKVQYSEGDIETINGFCISDYVELTKSEVTAIVKQLQGIIREADILEYSDLMDLLADSDMSTEFEVASNHTYFFDRYITSRRNKRKGQNGEGGDCIEK